MIYFILAFQHIKIVKHTTCIPFYYTYIIRVHIKYLCIQVHEGLFIYFFWNVTLTTYTAFAKQYNF